MFILVKIEPPKIAPFHFPEEVEVSGSTQATCSLVSGDKPIQFTWLKDNLPIPPTLKVSLNILTLSLFYCKGMHLFLLLVFMLFRI